MQAPTPGERTRIFVGTHFARPHFAADPAGRWLAKDAREGSLIVRLELRFTHPCAE